MFAHYRNAAAQVVDQCRRCIVETKYIHHLHQRISKEFFNFHPVNCQLRENFSSLVSELIAAKIQGAYAQSATAHNAFVLTS
jgi:hypothetical protein